MHPTRSFFHSLLLSTLCGLLLATGIANAAEAQPAEPTAVTTNDPNIPLNNLELLLQPLTKEELLVEVVAWRDLLKAKVQEIVRAEITTRTTESKLNELADVEVESEMVELVENAEAKVEGKKDETLTTLITLREQQMELLSRLSAAIAAYEAKGGDVTDFRKYSDAVSRVKVEITDIDAVTAATAGWLTSKDGGIQFLKYVVRFLIVVLIFYILGRFVRRMVNRGLEKNPEMSGLLKQFLDTFIVRTFLVIGALVGLSMVGVNVGALMALVGGGAFIIGFALQETLGNFAAGMMLLIYHPFDVGDIVEVGGVSGVVHGLTLVSTTIKTFDNKTVIVPNKRVWGEVITNSTTSTERRVDMVFGIGYSDDVDKALEILQKIVDSQDLVLKHKDVTIQMHELADSSVNLICRPWVRPADYWAVYWAITKQVKREFDAAGISIPFPQRDVHVYNVDQ